MREPSYDEFACSTNCGPVQLVLTDHCPGGQVVLLDVEEHAQEEEK